MYKDPINISEEGEPRYAGFGVRVLATMIDTAVFIPAIIISFQNQLGWKVLSLELFLIAGLMLYKPFMEWKYQATIGKMVMKIKVIDEVGGPLTTLQSFIRSSLFMASSLISSLTTIVVFQSPGFKDVITFDDLVEFQKHGSYENATQSISLILMAAVMFILFDRKRQGIHDKMANTYCVYRDDLP